MILEILLSTVRANLTCDDVEMADKCFMVCDREWNDCLDKCETNDCKFECHFNQNQCTDNCPCMRNCPNGCENCGFCACYEIESNQDFINCRNDLEESYITCLAECSHDPVCMSDCLRIYDQSLEKCPCGEECPNGCPCEGYECTETTPVSGSVLVKITKKVQDKFADPKSKLRLQ